MEDELLTVEEVARTLKVTRKAVYDMMRANRLPYVQLGIARGRRIRRSDLESFVRKGVRGLGTGEESDYTKGQQQSPSLATA